MSDFQPIIDFIKSKFPDTPFIPLHEPRFQGNERKYVLDAIDSTYVSSVGRYVDDFEVKLAEYTGAKHAVAMVNGTAALHLALLLAGVKREDEVLTQALTFVATANAISYAGAKPTFVDVDRDTMGLSADAIESYLKTNVVLRSNQAFNRHSGRRVAACVPMHTFGLPCRVERLKEICDEWHIPIVEDAAESLGSYINSTHTGKFGLMGTLSFNGNKTITCGGGGAIVTNSSTLAKKTKHLSTQAKVAHPWAFEHDEIGYNYRMPNLNAALACAQLEVLPSFVDNKRELASDYLSFFKKQEIVFKSERSGTTSNYWLNAIQFANKDERDQFLNESNQQGVMTRPIWNLMTSLSMYADSTHDGLENSRFLADRIVNIPSSVRA
ncbi:MAG: LegC family aminotransferase [Cyclobacteriaceae bacterium]